MDALGIDNADIGLPGAGGRTPPASKPWREIVQQKLRIRPTAGPHSSQRHHSIAEISQRAALRSKLHLYRSCDSFLAEEDAR